MRFPEYAKWLAEQVANTALEESCVQIGPLATPTVTPDKPPWQMEWTVFFKDGLFFRIVENWYRRASSLGGVGYRKHFSFHYGPANPERDAEGIPLRSESYPAIIRIDQDDQTGPHLHYGGEDHIPQHRVKNLRISDAEPFEFIKAVMEHRRSHESLDKIMRFKVTK
ncbi:MAG: hypothetical protein ACLP7O_05925 [Terracidiphilus sp.]